MVVSVLPVCRGMAGLPYLVIALLTGGALLLYGRRLAQARTVPAARAVMAATIVYLPLILAGILIDSLL